MSSKTVCTSSSLFSNKSMARTKQCPHGPSPRPTPQPPPPHGSDSEPDYGDPDETILLASTPTSNVSLKSPSPKKQRTAAAVASLAIADELEEEKVVDPVKRKHGFGTRVAASLPTPKPPFVRGQIGNIIYTSKPALFLGEMPDGCSLIVRSWRKTIPEKEPHGKYILTDPFGGIWYAPEAFNEWRAGVDAGSFPEVDLEVTHLAIVHEGEHFSICTSKRKQSFRDVLHPISSDPDKL